MDIKNKLRHVLDFPQKGIDFIDITPVLQDAESLKYIIDKLADELKDVDFDLVVSSESRGFILGTPVAYVLNKGFVPIRKQGKLPYETINIDYDLEYGTNTLEMHVDAVKPGQRVILIDDILATGGTIEANIKLVEQLGGIIVKIVVLADLTELPTQEFLNNYDIFSLVKI